MPFIFQYSDYDDYKILGLYHTLEEAYEARERYITVEIPRQTAENKSRFRWLVANSSNYTEEDIPEEDSLLDEEAMVLPDKLRIWELDYGDGWDSTPYPPLG